MKSTLSVVLFALTLLVGVISASAQSIPEGPFVSQVKAFDDGTSMVTVQWTAKTNAAYPYATMETKLDPQGKATEMWIHFNYERSSGAAYGLNSRPGDETARITTPTLWQNFATKVRKGYWFGRSSGLAYYVETERWTLISVAHVVSSGAFAEIQKTLLFKRGEQYLPIKLDDWMGEVPVLNSSVLIGRWNDTYAPATASLDGYRLSDTMTAHMAIHKTYADAQKK